MEYPLFINLAHTGERGGEWIPWVPPFDIPCLHNGCLVNCMCCFVFKKFVFRPLYPQPPPGIFMKGCHFYCISSLLTPLMIFWTAGATSEELIRCVLCLELTYFDVVARKRHYYQRSPLTHAQPASRIMIGSGIPAVVSDSHSHLKPPHASP